MVNRGRSGGCVTCKQRRVKCDEEKPNCQSCRRLGFRCGGYKSKNAEIKFKDQNHKFFYENDRERAVSVRDSVPALRLLAEPDTAVPFFLGHYASMGRDIESARGFFEILIPVYSSQPQNSPFSFAVSAVASEILSIWRQGPNGPQSPQESYHQAIVSLRSATQDRIERAKPATLLAALALHLYENIAAIYGLRPATRIHLDGVMSLLPHANLGDFNDMIGAYIRRFILHTEISSAMRRETPLQSIAYSWIGSKDSTAVPDNPSSALDAIGACVAELQANYMQAVTQNSSTSPPKRDLGEWVAEAKRIDERLLAWARTVPNYWQPVKLVSGQDIDKSIPTYRSACEVYPTCQIATIWNLWRVQRLLLIKISLSSLYTILGPRQSDLANDQKLAEHQDILEYQQAFQDMVDSVCYSVPFYLGNRTQPSSMADFTDPAILFPSDHLPAPENMNNLNKQIHNPIMPREEHRRHIISQGPWSITNPLSRLMTFFLEDDDQTIMAFLRPGQYEWISEQFLRVTVVLRIPPAKSDESNEGCGLSNSSSQSSVNNGVEQLVERVRKGAVFLSGP